MLNSRHARKIGGNFKRKGKKYSLILTAALVVIGGAGYLLWAQIGVDLADYPDAKEYAPNFWFDSDEKYYPADPLDFYFDKNGEELPGKTAVAKYDELSIEEKLEQAKVFYKVDDTGAEFVYQYWLFYVMNNYENGHYGDWESVFVFVDKEFKNINKVVGSAHGSGHVLQIKLEDTRHISVYVGNGSHANCPDEAGDGNCDFLSWSAGTQGLEWDKEDVITGKKIYFTDYSLYELNDLYIEQFQGENSFGKEKSPALGINPYKSLDLLGIPHPEQDKYYNLPIVGEYVGKTPTFAWAKKEYHNPEEILVPTHTKIARNIGGLFNNAGNFLAAVGRAVVAPLTTIFNGNSDDDNISGSEPESSDDFLSELTVDSGNLAAVGPAVAPIVASVSLPAPNPISIPASIPASTSDSEPAPTTDDTSNNQTPEESIPPNNDEEVSSHAPKPKVLIYEPQHSYSPLTGAPMVSVADNTTFNSYSDINNEEDGYQILLSGTAEPLSIVTISQNPTYTVTTTEEGTWASEVTLPAEGAHIFKISTISSDGIKNASDQTIITLNLDSIAPTSTISITNYAIDSDQFKVNWAADSEDIDSYEAEYKMGETGEWQTWFSGAASSKNYQNAATNTYYFRVRGTDIHGNIGSWRESGAVAIDLYQIVINEIQINNAEFVELYNPTASQINLRDYYFSYYSSTKIDWRDPWRNQKFENNAKIPANGYFLIGLDGYPTTGGNPNADWQVYTSKQLGNSQGTIAIFPFDPKPAISSQVAYDDRVDAVGWGSGIALYEGASAITIPAAGESLTRDSDHTDTDDNSADFTVATSTTPTNSKGETYVPPPPPSNPVWAMYQKDARHSGLATLSGPAWTDSSQATAAWTFEMKKGQNFDGARSQPVIGSDGVVYVISALGNVYAINTDGSQKWKFEPSKNTDGGDGTGWASASPALSSDGSVVYSVHTDTENIPNRTILYAIRASDKTRLWKYSINSNDGFTSPILDSAGNIYVASKSNLYSISSSGNLNSGWPKNLSSSGIWIRMPAIGDDGYIYVASKQTSTAGDGYIWKFDTNGNEIKKEKLSNANHLFNGVSINATGTIYTGGYFSYNTSGLYALDPSDLSQVWYTPLNGNVSGPVPNFDADGNIYIGTRITQNTGAFRKLNMDGTIQWQFSPGAPSAVQYSAVIDGQGRVYVGAQNKFVYALDPDDGSVIWEYELSDYAVGFAIGDGVIYVVSYDGKLYAL